MLAVIYDWAQPEVPRCEGARNMRRRYRRSSIHSPDYLGGQNLLLSSEEDVPVTPGSGTPLQSG